MRYLFLFFVILLASCATIDEHHYMGAFTEPTADNPTGLVNVFRVNIKGQGALANIRYITGTYDERAVDFFLNEVKSEDYAPSAGLGYGPDKILNLYCANSDVAEAESADCKKAYKAAMAVSPLSTSGDPSSNDAFVIILSSNANAIAETIGAIAESDIAMRSMNYLLNKDTIEDAKLAKARETHFNSEKQKAVAVLKSRVGATYRVNNDSSVDPELLILNLIAAELQPDNPIVFNTIDEARIWFSSVR